MRAEHFTISLSLIYGLFLIQEGIDAEQMTLCQKMLNSTGKMENKINELDQEITKINVELGEMNGILGKILMHLGLSTATTTATVQETTTALQCLQDSQAFAYNGKCFWLIVESFGPTRTYDLTRSWCLKQGGDVANVYSEEHYELVSKAVSSKVDFSHFYFWTNMTYDHDLKKVLLGTTEEAPYVKWYDNDYYPLRYSGWDAIKIQYDSLGNGYYNRPPSYDSMGVLCQA